MKKNVFKFGLLISLLFLTLTLSGCIDVLHMVRVNKNSMTIQYRIALSKQITGMQQQQETRQLERSRKRRERLIKQREEAAKQGSPLSPLPPEKPVVKKKSPMENMGEGFSDFWKKNKSLLSRYKAGEINSNTEVGWKASFVISKRNLNKIKPGDNPPLTPRYNAKTRRMVFEFKDNPMEKGKKKNPNKKLGGGIDDSAAAIFSTAIYTIVVSGNSRAKSAYVQKIGGKERETLEVIKDRQFSIIKFPWISMFIKHQQYRVVVQL